MYLIKPHIITKHALKPFLQDRIETTRLVNVCSIDAGHDGSMVVCKLDEPLIPLFLEAGTEWHGNCLCHFVFVTDGWDTDYHRARQASEYKLFETTALFVATCSSDPRFARLKPWNGVFEVGITERVDEFVEDGIGEHESDAEVC